MQKKDPPIIIKIKKIKDRFWGTSKENPILDIEYGIYLEYNFLSTYNIIFYCSVVLISILVGLIPAYRGYKKSLNSGI